MKKSKRQNLWNDAYMLWFDNLRTYNTKRAYKSAWTDLRSVCDKPYWKICVTDIIKWMNVMQQTKHLSAETVCQRLAGISSFYTFVIKVYMVVDKHGKHTPLSMYNPIWGIKKPRIYSYGKAEPLTPEQAKKLLSVIDKDCVTGKRYYAMLLGYITTGRRNSELRCIKWGDIKQSDDGSVVYKWSGKGKEDERSIMHRDVYDAICDYLEYDERLHTIHDDDYVFTSVYNDINRPISGRTLSAALKYYTKIAGLDYEKIHVHTLRHTYAYLLELSDASVDAISRMLGHSNINTTQVYMHRMFTMKTKLQDDVLALLKD